MIVVRVELHSAVNGQITELARAHISNIGGTNEAGDYECVTLRGRSTATIDRRVPQRHGKVLGHARLREHVWNLVAKALTGMGYGREVAPETNPRPKLLAFRFDRIRAGVAMAEGITVHASTFHDARDAARKILRDRYPKGDTIAFDQASICFPQSLCPICHPGAGAGDGAEALPPTIAEPSHG